LRDRRSILGQRCYNLLNDSGVHLAQDKDNKSLPKCWYEHDNKYLLANVLVGRQVMAAGQASDHPVGKLDVGGDLLSLTVDSRV
jgi:hypothetical protein